MTDLMEEYPSSGIPSSGEEEEELQVESLIQGRAKRSTAGLHMSALIDAAADDDLTLLFEEVEDDNEFAMDAEAAEEDDMGLDSSSDDDDDQGPNAQNDYEGEMELQKEERKKRRAQNDLRFQTLRKRVKIDPTAVSSIPVPPRPKKKSERISWLPTVEDGPTRSSSRRQTMVNKELTHARLKDSQEKRIRIIATMKEAEKRKAHLKPKEMTQEDHLAEAARIERTNSKSLNRWEQTEKRKAEERRAKIEALQNRRLEGPVISYWSGLATFVNGRLTRVGKVDVKMKPEKEEVRKKKKEKDEKPASEVQAAQSTTPAPSQPPTASVPSGGDSAPAPSQPSQPSTNLPSDPQPLQETSNSEPPASLPTPDITESNKADASSDDKPIDESMEQQSATEPAVTKEGIQVPSEQQPVRETAVDSEVAKPIEPEGSNLSTDSTEKQSEPVVEAVIPRRPSAPTPGDATESASAEQTAIEMPDTEPDLMDIDPKPEITVGTPKAEESQLSPTDDRSNKAALNGTDVHTGPGEAPQTTLAPSITEMPSKQVSSESAPAAATATTTPPDAQNPQTPQAPSTNAALLQATPPNLSGVPTHGQQIDNNVPQPLIETPGAAAAAAEPAASEIPPLPLVTEHMGRNLTILENFDDRTAHSKKFSMYFNAKKPPRLTKISSSLCVITSLPSRYRDPETSLPYANSYAYGQIRRMLSEGYVWSSMLGCFVGPAGSAARGVPDRFLGNKTGSAGEGEQNETSGTVSANANPTSTEVKGEAKTTAEPMEVDK
ncbi:hypothetical protein N7462_009696 [Penicillium macrosclerotiorum]|uniref:uncharacterized protein n=1 Tax=Penicillium macrosclerotiorum TaxID=303699 RepID=UPI0025472615|nr:uncharacterized protein N7462_009696 [Penicillium macrosclerotiorum]KAJ5674257.1 hypothetical protein N7462_009696 [Penicillium macrosclerotiorum]